VRGETRTDVVRHTAQVHDLARTRQPANGQWYCNNLTPFAVRICRLLFFLLSDPVRSDHEMNERRYISFFVHNLSSHRRAGQYNNVMDCARHSPKIRTYNTDVHYSSLRTRDAYISSVNVTVCFLWSFFLFLRIFQFTGTYLIPIIMAAQTLHRRHQLLMANTESCTNYNALHLHHPHQTWWWLVSYIKPSNYIIIINKYNSIKISSSAVWRSTWIIFVS